MSGVRASRWVALPITLTALTLVLIGLRIRIVRQRASDWSGEGCVIGPYNPAERYYLYAITVLLIFTLVGAILVFARTQSRAAPIIAVAVIVVCVLIGLYVPYVWGGFEINDQPQPEEPCPTAGQLAI